MSDEIPKGPEPFTWQPPQDRPQTEPHPQHRWNPYHEDPYNPDPYGPR